MRRVRSAPAGAGALMLLLTACAASPTAPVVAPFDAPPRQGARYVGALPGGTTGTEDDVTPATVDSFEAASGLRLDWVYVSDNWFSDRDFPTDTARWIADRGALLYVRIMLRSSLELDVDEPVFTLDAIVAGEFDADLAAWGRDAAAHGGPLLAEYGTEVNGDWFDWSPARNGAGRTDGYGDPALPDGAERFRDAYRHIVEVTRAAGATNVTWVYHVAADDRPAEPWNALELSYPGPQWVGWFGISAYGATLADEECEPLADQLDRVVPRLAALAPAAPIVVAEFGTSGTARRCDAGAWTADALAALASSRWPGLVGYAWWNEDWDNEPPEPPTRMRLESVPEVARAFRERAAGRGRGGP